MFTTPDLSMYENILRGFINMCNEELRKCIKRILRSLNGCIEIKLKYTRWDCNEFFLGFVDADWGYFNGSLKKTVQ